MGDKKTYIAEFIIRDASGNVIRSQSTTYSADSDEEAKLIPVVLVSFGESVAWSGR